MRISDWSSDVCSSDLLRRMRFFACGVLAINSSSLSNGQQGRSTASTEQPNRARSSESMSRCGRFQNDRTLLEGCAHSQRAGEGQWRLRENPALALAFGAIKGRSPALDEADDRAAASARLARPAIGAPLVTETTRVALGGGENA